MERYWQIHLNGQAGGYPHFSPGLLVDRWWCTHTPLYRRSVCDAIGPWVDLKYSQDYEYDGRIGSLGTKLVFCDELVSEHRTHGQIRQTGHGGWLDPPDQVKFFSSLYDNAIKAGVTTDTVEMRHFSRWVFLNARQCGDVGDSQSSRICFELAVKAAGKKSYDFRIYQLMAMLLGWNHSGALTCWLDGLLKRYPGSMTRNNHGWRDRIRTPEISVVMSSYDSVDLLPIST